MTRKGQAPILSTGPESGSWVVSAARGQELCGLSGCSGSPFGWSALAEMGCWLLSRARVAVPAFRDSDMSSYLVGTPTGGLPLAMPYCGGCMLLVSPASPVDTGKVDQPESCFKD